MAVALTLPALPREAMTQESGPSARWILAGQ